jgi:TatA/E family protein of Tat protein translocase
MGQLGFQELFVIFLIALLVFGPKKLPELGKSLGKGLREFKRATEDLKQNWEEQMRETEAGVKDIYADIDSDPSMTGPPVYSDEPQEETIASKSAASVEATVPKEKV